MEGFCQQNSQVKGLLKESYRSSRQTLKGLYAGGCGTGCGVSQCGGCQECEQFGTTRASLRMQREMQGASAAVECEDSEVATFVEVLLEAEVEQSLEEETEIVRLSDVRGDGRVLRSDVRCRSGELQLRDGTFRSSGGETSAGIFLPGRG